METLPDAPAVEPTGLNSAMAASLQADDLEVQRLARTFAVTPQAARLAMARVGTDFRALQRELGGRR